MTETGSIVVDTATRIFADLADPQTINGDKDGRWRAPLWQALEDAGLPLCWVPEAQGGVGIDLAEGFAVVSAAGRHGIGAPLVETMLAGWLLAQGGLQAPPGILTVAPASHKDRLVADAGGVIAGRARRVPFAGEAQHIAVVAIGVTPMIALIAAKDCRIEEGCNLAGDRSDTVVFDRVRPVASAVAKADFNPSSLMMMGAALRSLQIAGALQAALDLSVTYANERVAFEKKIGKFQAVQHNLAKLAGETAAALAAAGSAADAIASAGRFDDAAFLEIAAAKVRCAEAAEKGAAIAHQVHGAIGFSQEHILHRYTLRALGWRDDFGSDSYWAVELGRMVAARGADELWPLVASR